ncbi:hypothetical protein KEM54_003833 [Ascosphaera aggregata]|nr:hypothetical protein KEM54_003833 [Ascosphaera aggregata]
MEYLNLKNNNKERVNKLHDRLQEKLKHRQPIMLLSARNFELWHESILTDATLIRVTSLLENKEIYPPKGCNKRQWGVLNDIFQERILSSLSPQVSGQFRNDIGSSAYHLYEKILNKYAPLKAQTRLELIAEIFSMHATSATYFHQIEQYRFKRRQLLEMYNSVEEVLDDAFIIGFNDVQSDFFRVWLDNWYKDSRMEIKPANFEGIASSLSARICLPGTKASQVIKEGRREGKHEGRSEGKVHRIVAAGPAAPAHEITREKPHGSTNRTNPRVTAPSQKRVNKSSKKATKRHIKASHHKAYDSDDYDNLGNQPDSADAVIAAALACPKDCKGVRREWFLDSGASYHMTPDSSMLVNYQRTSELAPAFAANGEQLQAIGKGTLILQVGSATLEIPDVRHVTGCKYNLLSLSKLERQSFTVTASGAPLRFEIIAPDGQQAQATRSPTGLYAITALNSHAPPLPYSKTLTQSIPTRDKEQ